MLGDQLGEIIPTLVILARMLLAVALGAAIGLERELKQRPAGLRTHMLVSLAAAVFTMITIEIHREVVGAPGHPPADPVRVVEAVTAGVAFIAAGSIIRSEGDVKGLTTGVAIWLAGAVGVACGFGYYTLAVLATILAVAVLRVLGAAESSWLDKGPDE